MVTLNDTEPTCETYTSYEALSIQLKHSKALAVSTHNASYSYGKSNENAVLQETNLRVPKGVIYALLGPSGCGKTTLLKTLAGLITLDHGELWVFGQKPGGKNSTIPGPGLGYMPQELAIYDRFSVQEMVLMFSSLHGVKKSIALERYEKISKSLKLPSGSLLLGNASGGQKRRVSLACALINYPKLLILDEPTVGIDPVLRKNIWEYLLRFTQNEKTTIIITTHYVEEARYANLVGLMRKGKILVESEPMALMRAHNTATLENCFIHLCQSDNVRRQQRPRNQKQSFFEKLFKGKKRIDINVVENDGTTVTSQEKSQTSETGIVSETDDDISLQDEEDNPDQSTKERLKNVLVKVQALFWRNAILLKRNIILLLFELGLPPAESIGFCIFIGTLPFDLPLAIVNHEPRSLMGDVFLSYIDNETVRQNRFTDFSTAIQSVKDGHNLGVLEIPHNFTKCLVRKFGLGKHVDNDTISCSTVSGHMDFSNYLLASTLNKSFYDGYEDFLKEMLTLVEGPLEIANPILDFSETVYGEEDTNYTVYLLPNIIMVLIYTVAVALTTITFISERKQGIYDRFLISGVTDIQILLSHILLNFFILVIQIGSMLVIPVLVFGFEYQGSIVLLLLLAILQGYVGMTFGLLISAVTSNENMGLTCMNGVVMALALSSGFLWPVEGMPKVMKIIAYLTNLTLPSQAFVAIMNRGWGLEHPDVQIGFLVSIVWITIFIICITLVLKFKK